MLVGEMQSQNSGVVQRVPIHQDQNKGYRIWFVRCFVYVATLNM